MLFKYFMAALSLSCGIFAEPPPGKVILGYRTVSKEEADKINAAGRPIWEAGVGKGGRQLGEGVYTTPKAGQWWVDGPAWYCVIYIAKDRLADVSKIWVPHWKGSDMLWWTRQGERERFVTNHRSDWNPARTLYLSEIDSMRGSAQLLIPPELVAPEGALDLSATCVQFYNQLPDDAPTTYQAESDFAWAANMAGSFDDSKSELRVRDDNPALS